MKRNSSLKSCALVAMSALASATVSAQTNSTSLLPTATVPPAPPAGAIVPPPSASAAVLPASAGLVNDWLRQENKFFNDFDIGGQFRARYVYQTYFAIPGAGATAVDFRATTPYTYNDFLLLRTRIHVGYSPVDWFDVFGEAQNSSSIGDKRNPNPQSDGPMDLHQGYVILGPLKDLPLAVKVGRQELAYGDERLVGVSDWDNIGRVFDDAKLHYQQDTFWVDAFTGRVVIPNDNEFDQPNWDDWFSGIYGSTSALVPNTLLQLYFLADNASSGSPNNVGTAYKGNSPRDIYTIGTRFQTLPNQFQGWDFNGEFAGQFGDFEYPANTPGVINGTRLNQRSYATHIEGGYTFTKVDLTPRFALGFDYGSGDGNTNDSSHNTFVNLYPTNHKFYGAMDFFSWQNMLDPYFKAIIIPGKGLSVALTYNAFWLATTTDFFYQVNQYARTTGGYGIHPQNGSFVGQEIDLIATYTPRRWLQLQGGYGHFFTASYVNETFQNLGGSHDANWLYAQAQFSF